MLSNLRTDKKSELAGGGSGEEREREWSKESGKEVERLDWLCDISFLFDCFYLILNDRRVPGSLFDSSAFSFKFSYLLFCFLNICDFLLFFF